MERKIKMLSKKERREVNLHSSWRTVGKSLERFPGIRYLC
jgi:hypothetical protein